MGKAIRSKRFLIVGIIIVMLLICAVYCLLNLFVSVSTAMKLNMIAMKMEAYVEKNSQLPPNLEAIGYDKNNNSVILEYYKEAKVWYGLKVIAVAENLPWQWSKKCYGIVLEEGNIDVRNVAPFSKPLSRSTETVVIERLIKDPDPEVGVHLLDWLDHASKYSLDRKLKLAIEGIGLYRVKEGLEDLKRIYKKTYSDSIKKEILKAFVRINDPSQVPFLLKCLNDKNLDDAIRCEIAAAVTVQGESEGRDFLLERYKIYLHDISTKSSWNGWVRDSLERIYDPILVQRIAAIKDRNNSDRYSIRAMNNISTLIARMEINNLNVDKLLELAQNNDFQTDANKRYWAVYCLGQKAGPEVIPVLKKIKPWVNKPRGLGLSIDGFAEDAIKEIRFRHWKTLNQDQF